MKDGSYANQDCANQSYANQSYANQSYWNKFMRSGRVEDYLTFKSSAEQNCRAQAGTEASEEWIGSSVADRIKEETDRRKGDYPHAGFCGGNGDSTKGDAYR